MRCIQLTRKKLAIVADVDYEYLNQFKWFARYSKGNWYAERRIGEVTVFMHNELLGRKKGFEIDHQDRNGLNNQRSNLRYSTPSQNRANVGLRKDNKSGYKGVSYYPKSKKWRAYIQVNKKWKQLGYFKTALDAARAYNKVAKQEFGEFAWLNKI